MISGKTVKVSVKPKRRKSIKELPDETDQQICHNNMVSNPADSPCLV